MMRLFSMSLKKDARFWYVHLGRGKFSCFASLIGTCYKQCCPNHHEE